MQWKYFGWGLILSFFACKDSSTPVLTIAAAANVQYATEELASQFTSESGFQCHLIVSSSGKLTAQILSGAPYDVLLSADLKYPQTLYEAGFSVAPPLVYATGQLVLWTLLPQLEPNMQNLSGNDIRHIALANPKTAPYGQAAFQALEYYGWQKQLNSKFVYGESIAQTTQFISTGACELGFTAKSVVVSPALDGKGSWSVVPPESYDPIDQGMVLVNRQRPEELDRAAKAFQRFMFSAEAQKILEDYGYLIQQQE